MIEQLVIMNIHWYLYRRYFHPWSTTSHIWYSNRFLKVFLIVEAFWLYSCLFIPYIYIWWSSCPGKSLLCNGNAIKHPDWILSQCYYGSPCLYLLMYLCSYPYLYENFLYSVCRFILLVFNSFLLLFWLGYWFCVAL